MSRRSFISQKKHRLYGKQERYQAVLWEGSKRSYSQTLEIERPSLPPSARVVVCGGGVIGTSVAYHLAKAGWTDVILLEQGQ